jgi:hypothetical protein
VKPEANPEIPSYYASAVKVLAVFFFKFITLNLRRETWQQGCQIFLDTVNQNGEKYTKLTLHTLNYHGHKIHIPNGRKIIQRTIKYPNIFQSKALQNLPKNGLKIFHLATLWRQKNRTAFRAAIDRSQNATEDFLNLTRAGHCCPVVERSLKVF